MSTARRRSLRTPRATRGRRSLRPGADSSRLSHPASSTPPPSVSASLTDDPPSSRAPTRPAEPRGDGDDDGSSNTDSKIAGSFSLGQDCLLLDHFLQQYPPPRHLDDDAFRALHASLARVLPNTPLTPGAIQMRLHSLLSRSTNDARLLAYAINNHHHTPHDSPLLDILIQARHNLLAVALHGSVVDNNTPPSHVDSKPAAAAAVDAKAHRSSRQRDDPHQHDPPPHSVRQNQRRRKSDRLDDPDDEGALPIEPVDAEGDTLTRHTGPATRKRARPSPLNYADTEPGVPFSRARRRNRASSGAPAAAASAAADRGSPGGPASQSPAPSPRLVSSTTVPPSSDAVTRTAARPTPTRSPPLSETFPKEPFPELSEWIGPGAHDKALLPSPCPSPSLPQPLPPAPTQSHPSYSQQQPPLRQSSRKRQRLAKQQQQEQQQEKQPPPESTVLTEPAKLESLYNDDDYGLGFDIGDITIPSAPGNGQSGNTGASQILGDDRLGQPNNLDFVIDVLPDGEGRMKLRRLMQEFDEARAKEGRKAGRQ